jgi:hypothetical protein
MSRTSTLPKRLQPMLATLTDAPFDDPGWVFEDKYDGFRMIAEIRRGKVALYSASMRAARIFEPSFAREDEQPFRSATWERVPALGISMMYSAACARRAG